MDLDELLQEERARYIHQESVFYGFVDAFGPSRFRGIHPALSEEWISKHLAECREYYEKHGTKVGKDSPWIESQGEQYGG